MSRSWRVPICLLGLLALSSEPSRGQWAYPGMYGMYGYSRWGADPGAGYMAAMGSYAKNQGEYRIEAAQANSIEIDNVVKWNQALMAQRRAQRQLQAQQDRQQAQLDAAREREEDLNNGTTLNDLLEQILEFNPAGVRSKSAEMPISGATVRNIPFESATEPISMSLSEMASEEGWPVLLKKSEFAPQREALRQAALRAVEEDAKGSVSPGAIKQFDNAVIGLRDAFRKETLDTTPGYIEADTYLRTLAGLARLLDNPNFDKILEQISTAKTGTLGDLIAFMQSFNLRFGPARSTEQKDLYQQLAPALAQVLKDGQPVRTGPAPKLPTSARAVLSGLSWDDLDTQAQH